MYGFFFIDLNNNNKNCGIEPVLWATGIPYNGIYHIKTIANTIEERKKEIK